MKKLSKFTKINHWKLENTKISKILSKIIINYWLTCPILKVFKNIGIPWTQGIYNLNDETRLSYKIQ